MQANVRVLHVIGDLAVAGAEMMLLKLASRSHGARFTHEVVTLDRDGAPAQCSRAGRRRSSTTRQPARGNMRASGTKPRVINSFPMASTVMHWHPTPRYGNASVPSWDCGIQTS